jgi:hypothetical protein
MREKTKKVIIINVVIFILEALGIYLYLERHSATWSPKNRETRLGSTDKRIPLAEDSSLVGNPPALLQQEFLCPTCEYKDIKESSELESILMTNYQNSAPLGLVNPNVFLFYTKFDMPVTSMLPFYPIYHIHYTESSLSGSERLFIRLNNEWKVDKHLFPYFERRIEQQIQHIIPRIDCSILFQVCWKYQLNHHAFPLFLVFNKSSSKDENLMRNTAFHIQVNYSSQTGSTREIQSKIELPNLRYVAPSTKQIPKQQNPSETIHEVVSHDQNLPRDKDELHRVWREKMEYNNNVIKEKIVNNQVGNSENAPLRLFEDDLKKERNLPTGNFLFSDSPTIREISSQEIYSFFNDTSPLYPKIVLFYSDFNCQACLHIRAPYQLVSSRVFKLISGYNSFHAERSIELIPFIHFYSFNLHYFVDQQLNTLFHIDFSSQEGILPKFYGFHFHIFQSQLLNNLKLWNLEKFEKINFNTIEYESIHQNIDGKFVLFLLLSLILITFYVRFIITL